MTAKAAIASVAMALFLTALKSWAAFETGSVALLGSLADTGFDLLASLLTLFSVRYAALPADDDHRFGHGKAEALSALVQVMLVTVSALFIGWRAIIRFGDGAPTAHPEMGIGVSLVAIAATLGLLAYQRHVIKKTGSVAIHGDHLHYQGDLLLNIAVIIAASQIKDGTGIDLAHEPGAIGPKLLALWDAREIAARMDAFKDACERMDWRALTALYAPDYEDPNGFHREYAGRAWKWWFERNNKAFLLRQIRGWDFSDRAGKGLVRVRMLLLCAAVRRDDQPYGYDGIVRIPRHKGAEVTCTWSGSGGEWRLVRTEPALPNFEEILWNSRPQDKEMTLVPGVDD